MSKTEARRWHSQTKHCLKTLIKPILKTIFSFLFQVALFLHIRGERCPCRGSAGSTTAAQANVLPSDLDLFRPGPGRWKSQDFDGVLGVAFHVFFGVGVHVVLELLHVLSKVLF